MSDLASNRRKFLKILGLSTTATLVNSSVFANFINESEIKKLNPSQQEFMMRYGKWMDDYIKVVRKLKATPENMNVRQEMMEITNEVKELQPELQEFMKDGTFELIFKASIQRVSDEI